MVSFILQLPVSVYESVIDIINGEVLMFHIINTFVPAEVKPVSHKEMIKVYLIYMYVCAFFFLFFKSRLPCCLLS